MTQCLFITGTDTEVGKTVVSTLIIQAIAQTGARVSGYKPVAAGCELTEQGMTNEDAIALQQASNVEMEYRSVNPYALRLPTSPHIAAQHEKVIIDESRLDERLNSHKNHADFVIVEGAGGWRVPISDDDLLSTWVGKNKLPVILVVGIRLGCLNHALLSYEAIKNDGVEVVGWIANAIDPEFEFYQQNIAFLEHQLPVPKLVEIPYCSEGSHLSTKDIGSECMSWFK